ncbi:MAG: hypothetical protein CMO40_06110 [Verrucomicrobiaceae bacterium]|nr:hypothetical protein [Verrucomicrobiaceae bacterium]
MTEQRPRRKRRRGSSRRWHRIIGAVFALPLLWLTTSGLLLQHQSRLGLDQKGVRSGWLLKMYDQIPKSDPLVTAAGRFQVAGWEGMLFLDQQVLEESGNLIGAVAKPSELVIATETEILVYDTQGTYLDCLREESLPAVPLEAVGIDEDNQVHLLSSAGHHVLGDAFLDYEEAPVEAVVTWSAVKPGLEQKEKLEDILVNTSEFTWARVITDLHSGSLLGKVGRFLVDVSGIAIIVVTILGIRLLFRGS